MKKLSIIMSDVSVGLKFSIDGSVAYLEQEVGAIIGLRDSTKIFKNTNSEHFSLANIVAEKINGTLEKTDVLGCLSCKRVNLQKIVRHAINRGPP